jgi:hypothetical protein
VPLLPAPEPETLRLCGRLPDEFSGGIVDVFGQQLGQPEPLPYADISDPQTLNKYACVRNNPFRYVDPDGHCPWCALAVGVTDAVAQTIADKATGQPITLRKEIAAFVGGAIIGGSVGLGTEAGIAVQIAIAGSAGVVGGVAERLSKPEAWTRPLKILLRLLPILPRMPQEKGLIRPPKQ